MSYANGYDTATGSQTVRPHGHGEFYDLAQADEQLQTRVEELEQELAGVRRELVELSGAIEEHGGTGEEHADLIEELTERVTWLEGVVAAAGLVKLADFDTFTDEDARLARLARLGREAEAALLSEAEAARNRGAIVRFERRVQAYREALATAAAAATVLGEIGPDDPELPEVAAAYRAARKAQPAALTDHERALAQRAADELAEDDIARQEVAETIEAGQFAAHEVLTRARTRVAAAVGRSELMPTWFASAVGRTAPAENPDRWIARAGAVLIYRLTYGLTGDQVRALGPKPDPQQDPARYALYDRLTRGL